MLLFVCFCVKKCMCFGGKCENKKYKEKDKKLPVRFLLRPIRVIVFPEDTPPRALHPVVSL